MTNILILLIKRMLQGLKWPSSTGEVVRGLVDGLFGWRLGQGLMPSDLSRARALAGRKDVEGAVHDYRRYYDEGAAFICRRSVAGKPGRFC